MGLRYLPGTEAIQSPNLLRESHWGAPEEGNPGGADEVEVPKPGGGLSPEPKPPMRSPPTSLPISEPVTWIEALTSESWDVNG